MRRKRGSVLEEAIRAAAIAELTRNGFAGFTIEAVAARAGTGKASIYRRWPTKQELLVEAIGELAAELCAAPMSVDGLPDDLGTLDALRTAGRNMVTIMSSQVGDLMRELSGEAARDPELVEAIEREFHAPRRAGMRALLQRGVERGEVFPGADLDLVGEVLPSILVHRIVIRRLRVSPADVDAIVDGVLRPLLAAAPLTTSNR